MRICKIFSIVAILTVCGLKPAMANPSMNSYPAQDFYSGNDDLKTIRVGISARSNERNRLRISVNIFQKKDGSYVVQVLEHKFERGRTSTIASKDYVNARKDSEGRIIFTWKNITYFTVPDTIRE